MIRGDHVDRRRRNRVTLWLAALLGRARGRDLPTILGMMAALDPRRPLSNRSNFQGLLLEQA